MSDATNSGQLELSLPTDGYVFTITSTGANWMPITTNSNPIQSVPVNNIIFSNNSFNTVQPISISQGQWPINWLNGALETDSVPEPIEKSNGCSCKRCKTFNEYAEPNLPDKTFMCYACRHGL